MKGIIVAAGYGTRFLPVTKTVPKEMLPLINKPAIAFIIDEFTASGINDIIIITSRRKKILDDYFDREIELEHIFAREGKADKAALIAPPRANISFARQTEMLGTGHALLQAAPFLGGEACVVAYPDDLHFGSPPLTRQLIDIFNATGDCVLAAVHEEGDVSRYGIIAHEGSKVRGFVEKPPKGTEPSHEITIGRYLYTPEFFEHLAEGWEQRCSAGNSGEYHHVYALCKMIEAGKVSWKQVEGLRLDTGEPSGYLEAILEYAWMQPEWRERIRAFVRSRGEK